MSARSRDAALVAALSRYLGDMRDVCHFSADWHSATFDGARHVIAFTLADNAVTAGLLDAIAEADLPLADGFVADVAITARETSADAMAVALEILTIDA